MRAFIGIDPGLKGALALIDHHGQLLDVKDMPVIPRSGGFVKNQIDSDHLLAQLSHWSNEAGGLHETVVVIENMRSMPMQGRSSIFSMGLSAGLIEGVVVSRRIPHHLVDPAHWKKHFKLTGKEKTMSVTLAKRLYPGTEYFNRKKDHDRAEAVLLARYGWEEMS